MAEDGIRLAELAAEEEELRFSAFDNDDAWALGSTLVGAARAQRAAVTVDISRNGQQLFHAALPGTAADNDGWIRRKTRVVNRFGHSSLYMGQLCREQGTTFEEKFRLDQDRYAAHGGAYPVVVRSVGLVGVVAVSGLPEVADHRLLVAVLRAFLAPPADAG